MATRISRARGVGARVHGLASRAHSAVCRRRGGIHALAVAACVRAGSPPPPPRAQLPVVLLPLAVPHVEHEVMVGGAESASTTRTSCVHPGNLICALKVPLSSPSFWHGLLIWRARRTLQASWPGGWSLASLRSAARLPSDDRRGYQARCCLPPPFIACVYVTRLWRTPQASARAAIFV